jgi:predicted ATPase
VLKVARDLHDAHLPITVQGIIAARIDRLPAAEKELLRTLAAIGKEFPAQLVLCVCLGQEEQLPAMLLDLQSGGFIYEDPAPPEQKYHFKHSLIHEVAYRSLLTQRRRMLHGSIAAEIEA